MGRALLGWWVWCVRIKRDEFCVCKSLIGTDMCMWKKVMLLFSFHTLFLVLFKVMPDLLVFHENALSLRGKQHQSARKIDTLIAVRLDKCYSFPCFYMKAVSPKTDIYHCLALLLRCGKGKVAHP